MAPSLVVALLIALPTAALAFTLPMQGVMRSHAGGPVAPRPALGPLERPG